MFVWVGQSGQLEAHTKVAGKLFKYTELSKLCPLSQRIVCLKCNYHATSCSKSSEVHAQVGRVTGVYCCYNTILKLDLTFRLPKVMLEPSRTPRPVSTRFTADQLYHMDFQIVVVAVSGIGLRKTDMFGMYISTRHFFGNARVILDYALGIASVVSCSDPLHTSSVIASSSSLPSSPHAHPSPPPTLHPVPSFDVDDVQIYPGRVACHLHRHARPVYKNNHRQRDLFVQANEENAFSCMEPTFQFQKGVNGVKGKSRKWQRRGLPESSSLS